MNPDICTQLRQRAAECGISDGMLLNEAADLLEKYQCHLPLSIPNLPSGQTGIEYRPAEPGEYYLNHGEWAHWVAQYPTAFYYVVATKGDS